jgi:hypothetical protein
MTRNLRLGGFDVLNELPAGSVCNRHAPVAQLAEAADSNPARCGFESHLGHNSDT